MKLTRKLLSVVLMTGVIASANTLVTVNGKAITQQEVDSELMNATQGRFNQVPADKQAEFRQQVLQQLIGKELIYNDAQKTGILKTKEYKEEYKKLEERMKKELAVQVWQKKVVDGIKISEATLKDYYKKNKEEFNEKKTVHARHILVKEEAEAKAIINELKHLSGQKLQAKFEELAKSKSTGPSGPKGGDLGFFAEGQMVPAFNDKVFSMKVGTITQKPVKTQFGYHVIFLQEKKDKATRSFNEVKPFIEQRLKMEKFKSVMNDKMAALQKNATIK
ncbi:peptidyl-prolyl cis-trans isomerase [Sulfurimonas sp. SAG-AH-194-L11]|nr:peptidylprolyl isomerase [Sulfurimonas sp. SAG-AH-194-L11]MDF1876504.1 peptidyl-prolyl cis-trans isomerase [Sulfurimonas sp. SAG-AH-194-L11]